MIQGPGSNPLGSQPGAPGFWIRSAWTRFDLPLRNHPWWFSEGSLKTEWRDVCQDTLGNLAGFFKINYNFWRPLFFSSFSVRYQILLQYLYMYAQFLKKHCVAIASTPHPQLSHNLKDIRVLRIPIIFEFFLYESVQHKSLTQFLKPFRFLLRIRGESDQKLTSRFQHCRESPILRTCYGESGGSRIKRYGESLSKFLLGNSPHRESWNPRNGDLHVHCWVDSPNHRKIRLIKYRTMQNVVILKNLPVKGLCGRCLSVWDPEDPPPLHTVYEYTVYSVLIHTGKGGRRGELNQR